MTASPHGSGARPPVVVAVVSWNTRDLLDRCLRSLEAEAAAGVAEVWVVDNASTDGSADLVRERHPWVRLVESGGNLGYGPAINLVAGRTASPWLAVSNADVVVREGALQRLLAEGEADPGVGIVAPRLVLPDGSTQHSVWAFPGIRTAFVQNLGPRLAPRGVAERLAVRGAWDPDRPRDVPWAIGAFLVVRRRAWDAVGGFDPEQWMSAEDLDLGWRLHRAGWVARYVPEAVVDHVESASTGAVWGTDLPLHWQRCAYSWMVRKRGRARTIGFAAINAAGAGGRYLLLLARARFRQDEDLRALRRWTLVHAYGVAPRRVLDKFR